MQNSTEPVTTRILLIEDQESIQRLVVSNLTKNGYEVIVATTGAQGLLLLPDSRTHVVIVDDTLPDMDSLELVRKIRSSAHGFSLSIVWLNARPCYTDLGEHQDIIDFVLNKPFNPHDLTQYVKRLLAEN